MFTFCTQSVLILAGSFSFNPHFTDQTTVETGILDSKIKYWI